MRFYNLIITDPTSGNVVKQYSSLLPNGKNNLAALNIEIDVSVNFAHQPNTNSMIKIWGISVQDIGQAANLGQYIDQTGNLIPGKRVQLFGGMSQGLPLAMAWQSGLLFDGVVQQGFGNWEGTNQTIDLVVGVGIGTFGQPKNITFEWPAGQTMGDMINGALSVAYPDFKIQVNTNSQLVRNAAEPGVYYNLDQFSKYIYETSRDMMKGTPGYNGVRIIIQNGKIIVSDQSTDPSSSNPTVISKYDLIGQVTWLSVNTISFKTVMRGDISVSDFISLPTGLQQTLTASSQSNLRDQSSFHGVFQISAVRHVGNFRQASGDAWVTCFEAYIPGGV